ncbi:mitotic checkpoint protein BUB3.3-like [Rutidosis leptorrhynchoides]|uniref:mitotic checkpoint protein BUB3.3-like n=1 Tax=Rutidosis leptorrhynchoides TaxID=125765 RepID=UPI003A9A1A79
MSGFHLEFKNPIKDAVSRIHFAPQFNDLLISSWDSKLRLFDVDTSVLRLEAPCEAALLDCCYQNSSTALTAGSDGLIRRYDLNSGRNDAIGNHDDIATSVSYSDETRQVISAGLDKRLMSWDTRAAKPLVHFIELGAEAESMSLSGYELMVAIQTSVYTYDVRNLKRPAESNESHLDVHIRCISACAYSRGFAVGSVDGRVALEISHPSNSNDISFMFRCHPKSKDGRYHLASVNDIVFNPFIRGAFYTGDNQGYVSAWDAQSRRRLFELPKYPNSVASMSCNQEGQLLAIASSYTYNEAGEIEEPPKIFIHKILVQGSFILSDVAQSLLSASRTVGNIMSDEEHHFESKADAGASKTYPQQAGTIRKNGYIVIKNRPCKVVEVSTSKTGKHGHAKCHFVGIDIFNGKKLEDIVPSSHNCDVPHVTRTEYQLIDISEDGFVSLLTDNGGTKDDLRLPTDESLLSQIKDGFAEGKDLVVSVMFSMGEEQINALKDIGPR